MVCFIFRVFSPPSLEFPHPRQPYALFENTSSRVSGSELQKQLSQQYATQLESLLGEVGPTDNRTDTRPPVAPRVDPHLRQEIESSQKSCLRLSDQKVTLATEAYDLVTLSFPPLSAAFHNADNLGIMPLCLRRLTFAVYHPQFPKNLI